VFVALGTRVVSARLAAAAHCAHAPTSLKAGRPRRRADAPGRWSLPS